MRERPPTQTGRENDHAEDEQRLLERELDETIYHDKIPFELKPTTGSLTISSILFAVRLAQIFFFKPNLDLHQRIAQEQRGKRYHIRQDQEEAEQRHAHAQEDRIARPTKNAVCDQRGFGIRVNADAPRVSHLRLRKQCPNEGNGEHE